MAKAIRINKKRIIDEFDAKATRYESNRLGTWYIAQSKLILDGLATATFPEGEMLDVGCGTGWLTRQLAALHPHRRVVGLDISPAMIRTAKDLTRGGTNLPEYRLVDWEAEPSPVVDHDFALIVCASVFHYFAEPLAALRRMRASLKPGGLLVLLERDTTGSLGTAFWAYLHRTLIKDHVTFYRRDQLIEMAKQAGFESVKVERRVRCFFWHGKLQTHIAILHGRASAPSA